jgi:small subunit ribosomal protein S8
MVEDKVSNLINSLKTASLAGKEVTIVRHSKLSESILELLKAEGYIADYEVTGESKKEIKVTLKYEGKESAIHDVKRVSKLSRRIYEGSQNIRKVKRGYGMSVVTTSKGVMDGRKARKMNVGGEVLFEIW